METENTGQPEKKKAGAPKKEPTTVIAKRIPVRLKDKIEPKVDEVIEQIKSANPEQ